MHFRDEAANEWSKSEGYPSRLRVHLPSFLVFNLLLNNFITNYTLASVTEPVVVEPGPVVCQPTFLTTLLYEQLYSACRK